jgi:hypothetical protein
MDRFDGNSSFREFPLWIFCTCSIGAAYQKPTRTATTIRELLVIGGPCGYLAPHEVLEGKVQQVIDDRRRCSSKTTVVGRYPPELCRAISPILDSVTPLTAAPLSASRRSSPFGSNASTSLKTLVWTPRLSRSARSTPTVNGAIGFSLEGESRTKRTAHFNAIGYSEGVCCSRLSFPQSTSSATPLDGFGFLRQRRIQATTQRLYAEQVRQVQAGAFLNDQVTRVVHCTSD